MTEVAEQQPGNLETSLRKPTAAPTAPAEPPTRPDVQSPEEEFHVQPLSKASRSVAGSAMGGTKKEKSSTSLKSSENIDDSTATTSSSSASSSVSKALAKKKKKKEKKPYGIHADHYTERLVPKTKRMTMVGGIPFYREVGDIKDIIAVHHSEDQNYLINGHLMAGVGFVRKKDFDTEPATLDELNPPLDYMPYEKP
eukprot:gene15969-34792_t